MRTNPLTAIVAFAAVAAAAPLAHAWDDEGHEIVAYIAYKELTPGARAKVDALLRQHPDYHRLLLKGCPADFDQDLYAFMTAATWPDLMRDVGNDPGLAEHHAVWHYVNKPLNLDGKDGPKPDLTWMPGSEPENIVQAFQKCDRDMKDTEMEDGQKAKSLCWIEHMTGDIHQPLHSAALFSNLYPKGDHGGNLFGVHEVTGAGAAQTSKPYELHAFWDQVLGQSKSEKVIAAKGETLRTNAEYTRAKLQTELKHTTYENWVDEAVELAKTVAYDNLTLKSAPMKGKVVPDQAPALPDGYRKKAEKVAEKQVVLAGYRLADKLNEWMK